MYAGHGTCVSCTKPRRNSIKTYGALVVAPLCADLVLPWCTVHTCSYPWGEAVRPGGNGLGLRPCCHRGWKGCSAFFGCVHKSCTQGSRNSNVETKNLATKMLDHGDPLFSRSACDIAMPAKWCALDMKRIMFMGWAGWCYAPACVYGPPACAYVMYPRPLN
jgi:hypothetical protein